MGDINKNKNNKENNNNNNKNKKRNTTIYSLIIVIIAAISLVFCMIQVSKNREAKEIKYEKFLEMVEDDKVKTIEWTNKKNFITVIDKNKKEYTTENPKYENFKKEMLEHGIDVEEGNDMEKYEMPIMLIFQLVLYGILFSILLKSTGLGASIFGDKKAKESSSSIKFNDVAGLDEVKEDLMTVVDFLKNPDEYKEAGAEIPKGVLLYGPPGTGKTLLAKAVAGEAEVKFTAVSGSDFDEKYVGVGASKMRKLFEDAKTNAPCIIFIDEIDSMGGRRHAKQSNYDRQTLNTLLSEMDGFDGSNGVVVMAATNRIEDLDPALTRPGRFDNHFAVGLPSTSQERKIIINLYSKNKKFAEDVDLESFAKETMGSSPASIKTILNEAAIIATRRNKGIINREILDEAWMKHLMEGHLKKNGNKDNIEIIAWHEAGHALAGLLMGQDLTKASIIPSTSGAGGATFITPKKLGLFTKKELEEQVMMLYAGRNAEKIYTNDKDGSNITTGASNDIEKATEIIHQLVMDYGMTDTYGMLNLNDLDIKPENVINEYISISKELKERSFSLLVENKDILQKIAEALIENETLTGKEIKEIAKKTRKK